MKACETASWAGSGRTPSRDSGNTAAGRSAFAPAFAAWIGAEGRKGSVTGWAGSTGGIALTARGRESRSGGLFGGQSGPLRIMISVEISPPDGRLALSGRSKITARLSSPLKQPHDRASAHGLVPLRSRSAKLGAPQQSGLAAWAASVSGRSAQVSALIAGEVAGIAVH